MSHFKKTLSHASIYAAGIILGRIVGFLMLPIYTKYLTTSDYGVLELMMMTIDIVSLIVGIGLVNGIFKFFYEFDDIRDKYAVISTSFILIVSLYGIAITILIINSSIISQLLFDGIEYDFILKLAILSLMFQICTTVTMTFFRAEQKPFYFITVNILRLFLQLSLNIYFIVVLQFGVVGAIYADFITSVIFGVILSAYTFRKVGFVFHPEKAKEMVRFGAPFILTNIGAFILTFSDRYFLKHYWDLNSVGVYSLGYKLGFILSLLISRPFSGIWEAQRFEVIKLDNRMEIINKTLYFYSFILISVGLAIAVFSKDLFRIMSSEPFWDAYKIVPIIVMAYIIQALTGFVNIGIYAKGKTLYITYATIFAVAVILVLSFLLIPKFGGIGAAIATLLAFIVRFIFVYAFSQKTYYLEYRLNKTIIFMIIGVISYILFIVLTNYIYVENTILSSIAIGLMVMIFYLFTLYFLPILPKHIKLYIIENSFTFLKIKNKK